MQRLLFKHKADSVFLLADAYDGEQIKPCTEDFLRASNGQQSAQIQHGNLTLKFGGDADLMAYIGHNGLMDFEVDISYVNKEVTNKRETIILACYSKEYFQKEIQKSGANPLLWTTHFMAPEAYSLSAALEGWIKGETSAQIDERAAQAYHQYQKCGIKGARNLFTTGF